jgi:F-type H+-transporting ATPase subunit b
VEALGIDWAALLYYLVSFLILLAVLQAFVFRPVLRTLENRQRIIRESLDNADQVKDQLARAQQDYEARMVQARQEAAQVVAQSSERAQLVAQEIEAQARANAERIVAEARQQTQQEREQILRGLQGQLANLVVDTASTVVGQKLDRDGHDRLIQGAIADLGRL